MYEKAGDGTGREVMEPLHKMNLKRGKTIPIVTHDPEIAAQCGRTIGISGVEVL